MALYQTSKILFYFFRVNDPYRLIGLLVILIIIYLVFFIDTAPLTYPELQSFIIGEKVSEGNLPYSGVIDSVAPLTSWFYGFLDMLFGRSLLARHLLGVLIVYLQSVYVGIMFIDKKVFTENTYLPSFLFSILIFFSFDTIAITGVLLGSGVLLLAINNLLKVIEFRTQREETFLNLGFFISIATLFDFSCVVFLVAAIVILMIYTRNTVRSYLLIVFGFLLPHLILISIYFLNDQADALLRYFYLTNLSFSSQYLITKEGLFVLAAFPISYLLISLIMINRDSRFTKYQSQLRQIMFLWMLFSCLQILYSKQLTPQSFITLIPGISFFITHFLLVIRRKRFAELNLWVLFVGIVAVAYLSRYGYLERVKYDQLFVATQGNDSIVKEKRIMVLGDELPLFAQNKLATPFYNWQLSKETFSSPEYYANVLKIHEAFKQDAPDVIIDKNDYMKGFMERLPELRKLYKQPSPGVYTKRTSN